MQAPCFIYGVSSVCIRFLLSIFCFCDILFIEQSEKMKYSYKFRIYPNNEQQVLIQKTFGCSRFIYNHFLAQRIAEYKATDKALTRL